MYNSNILGRKNQVNAIFTFVTETFYHQQVKVTKRSAFEKDTWIINANVKSSIFHFEKV